MYGTVVTTVYKMWQSRGFFGSSCVTALEHRHCQLLGSCEAGYVVIGVEISSMMLLAFSTHSDYCHGETW